MRDLYTSTVEGAAGWEAVHSLEADDPRPAMAEVMEDFDAFMVASKYTPALIFCGGCEQRITLAEDGAWEDSSGACGCGEDEHYPESNPF